MAVTHPSACGEENEENTMLQTTKEGYFADSYHSIYNINVIHEIKCSIELTDSSTIIYP